MLSDNGYLLIISHSRGRLLVGRLLPLAMLLPLLVGCACTARASVQEAESAYRQARYEMVLELLQVEPKPGVAYLLLLGKTQFQLGSFEAASASLRRSLDYGGDTAEGRMWLGRSLGMQAERANPFSALGLARKARDEFQKAVLLDPHHIEAVNDLFSFYLAAPSFLGGGTDKAHALAESIKAVDPAEYAGMQAQLAEKAKDYSTAEARLRHAIRLEPRRIGRRIDLAKFYTRREVFAKADTVLAEARALQPDAPRLLFDEANLLVRSGRNPARARQLLNQYLKSPRTSEDPSPFDAEQLSKKLEKLEKDSR